MDSDAILYRIMSGRISCQLDFGTVYITAATPSVLAHAEEIYSDTLYESLILGILTDEEMVGIMSDKGLWSSHEQEELDAIPGKLDELKLQYYRAYVAFQPRDILKASLAGTRKRHEELVSRRHAFANMTAEGVARLAKMQYLVAASTVSSDDKLVWADDELDLIPFHYIHKLADAYNDHIYSETQIRGIARSERWKSVWYAGKSERGVFGFPAIRLTDQQRQLISWSRFYDNVHESSDCPPNEVIDDDDLLDGWVTLTHREREDEKGRRQAENKMGGKLSKANEIYYVASTSDDVDRIARLNDGAAKLKKRQRSQLIKNAGTVNEDQLPDIKQELSMAAVEAFKQHVKGK